MFSQIHIQSVDHFGKRVGFVKFKADAFLATKDGLASVPGIVFMRGAAVGVLVVLDCDGKQYTILTYQARVPAGCSNLPEIPAGMMDGRGNFRGVAAEELAEEVGNLHPLTAPARPCGSTTGSLMDCATSLPPLLCLAQLSLCRRACTVVRSRWPHFVPLRMCSPCAVRHGDQKERADRSDEAGLW